MPQTLVPARHEARTQGVEDHFQAKSPTRIPRASLVGFFSDGGFYGVELFFVLSGFLIGTILVRNGSELGKPDHVAAFYIRRRFRTPPLFWLFLGVHAMPEHFNTNGMIKFAVGTTERLGRAFHFPIG
jgi:peptidoglycan/LPS O-acetylase OafA/YrhL